MRIVLGVMTAVVCAAWAWLSVRTVDCLRVVTRGTAFYSRRTVLLVKIGATVVAAPNVAVAAASFGANWFLGALFGAIVVLLAVMDKAAEISPATPQEPSSYKQSWQQYVGLRRQLVIYVLILIGLFVASFLTAVALGSRLTGQASTILFWLVSCAAIVPLAGYAYTAWKFNYWPCPRCGHRFRGPFSWALPKKCSHCGLPRWAEDTDLPPSATPLLGK